VIRGFNTPSHSNYRRRILARESFRSWLKGRKIYEEQKVKYTDDKGEIIGELRPMKKGELPSLDQLVHKLRAQTKVTLVLRT
jgi:gamma-glutamylcyclotransferase (GGCT)/AIG2-like uncharacterized protein YtfP